jgi:hypothetical protein
MTALVLVIHRLIDAMTPVKPACSASDALMLALASGNPQGA